MTSMGFRSGGLQINRTLRTLLILLVVVCGVALMGVRNVRAKIARCRIEAAQEMTESFCCMVENYMSDHRMSEPPKDLRVLLEIDRNNNEPYLAGGERFLDDPWGNPYRLVCEGKRWRVVSNGPDGVPDTVDDISFEKNSI